MVEHYYTKKPASKFKPHKIKAVIGGYELEFKTSSGVFSRKKVDKGTMLLINNCRVGSKVLDLGCGSGIIGIALKKKFSKIDVTCTDINQRAVKLTAENAEKNNVKIQVIQSDIFSNIPSKFDSILVNLPQHAGKELCFRMIEESTKHLNPNGTLQVVSRHQKGGKQYEKKMVEIFGNCDYLAKGSGFRVYISKK